ncbi:hypothetical protein CEQ90_19625, partial [Lewinellaceae bacterium SD302]
MFLSGIRAQGSDGPVQFIDQTIYPSAPPGSQGNIQVMKVIPTSDGGSLIMGSHLNQFQNREAYAWKVDSLANFQWFVEQGGENAEGEDRFTSAVELNGEYFLTFQGDFNNTDGRHAAVFHYNESGFLTNAYAYPDLNGNPVQLNAIAVGANNQLMVGGFFNNDNGDYGQIGWLDRLQYNPQFGFLEIAGAQITFGLGYVVTEILKNGPDTYTVIYGDVNPSEQGCGTEFIFRSDIVVSKRDAQLNESFVWVVGGTTADFYIDAVARPDGRVGILGFTFCEASVGLNGPLNVATSDGTFDPYWVAEIDVINNQGVINATSTLGGFAAEPGAGAETPYAIEYSDCNSNGYLVAAQYVEDGDPSTQYLDLYDVVDNTSENYYSQTGGPNDIFQMRDYTRILNGRFHQAGEMQNGFGIVHRLTSDGCTDPINCDAFETLECTDGLPIVSTTAGATDVLQADDYACSPFATEYDAPERIFRYEHFPGQQLSATLTAQNINLDLFIFAECPANPGSLPYECVGSSTNELEADGLNFDNVYLTSDLEPGTYYIVVDGVSSSDVGDFTLSVACYGAWQCQFQEEFTDLECGDVLTNDNFFDNGYFNRSSTYCSVSNNGSTESHVGLTGPEHLYEVLPVTDGQYTFTVTPLNPEDDFDIYLMQADGGLITDIFLEFCYNTTLCEFSNSNAGPGQTVTLSAELIGGEGYILIVDGRLGSEGQYVISMNCTPPCDLILYNIDCEDLDYFADEEGIYTFSSDSPTFTNDFEWQVNGQVISETGIPFSTDGNQLTADLSGLTGSSYEICAPFINDEECPEYCCQIICGNSIIEPYEIDFSFTDNGFLFEIDGEGVSQPSWYYFEDGQDEPTDLGDGFQTFLDLPTNCTTVTLYVRYFDITTQCWRIVSEDFFLCNPYDCDDVSGDFNPATNDWIVTLNDPGAGFITWRDDDTFTDFDETSNVLTLNFDGECRTRNISVRYRDADGTWRICCLSFYYCDPYDCGDLTTFYDPGVGEFFLTLNVPDAEIIRWRNDETGATIPGTGNPISIPFDGVCRELGVTVFYYDADGQLVICCLLFDYCVDDNCPDPTFDDECGSQQFITVVDNDNNYVFNAVDINFTTDEEWYVNGNPASESGLDYFITPGGGLNVTFTDGDNGEYEMCYPYEDDDGCINYCCRTYCINVIVEPFVLTHAYNAGAGGFDINLSGDAVSEVSWYYFPGGGITPLELGEGPDAFIATPSVCEVVTIYARYYDTASNCWRIVSENLFLCDPYECDEIDLVYIDNGFSILLSNLDATNIVWRDDVSGEILATNEQGIFLAPDGDCANRFISVRYRDADGIYRICCLVFYLCDPTDCNDVEISYNEAASEFQFELNANGTVTDIVWRDDVTGEIFATGTLTASLPFDGECFVRQITVTYIDEEGVFRICCPTYYHCDPTDCGDVDITYDADAEEFQFTLEANGTVTDIVWRNDITGEVFATGTLTASLPFDGECFVR